MGDGVGGKARGGVESIGGYKPMDRWIGDRDNDNVTLDYGMHLDYVTTYKLARQMEVVD